jgi:hypothetical protein
MDGNRRIIERMRKCYSMLGAKGNVEEYVSKGGHDYRPDLRVAIFSFFEEHMQIKAPGDVGKPVAKDAEFKKIEGKDLRCFRTRPAEGPDQRPRGRVVRAGGGCGCGEGKTSRRGRRDWKLRRQLSGARRRCLAAP